MIFDHPEFDRHERILHVNDARAGLRAIVAIHRGRGGMAVGGVRFRLYASDQDALSDVLRLSRAMTYKAVLADLPLGGAKSVIFGDPLRDKTPGLLRSFGRVVESLRGAYMCGPDVGTSSEDMDVIARETRHVGATTREMGSSAPPTAAGVFRGLEALSEHLFGSRSLSARHVAVQGAGAVGSDLVDRLTAAGARVTIADVSKGAAAAVAARTGAAVVPPQDILFVEADLLSPCALGGVFSAASIPRIRARGICGAANNQLATEADAGRLLERGVAFVPDFLASAGGVIAGSAAAGLYASTEMQGKLDGIYDRTLAILERARAESRTPDEVARQMAEEVLAGEGS